LAKKKTSLLSWFLQVFKLEADCFRGALVCGLLAAAGGCAIGAFLHMGQTIITEFKNIRADIGAHAAANTEIVINFWIHQVSSLSTLYL